MSTVFLLEMDLSVDVTVVLSRLEDSGNDGCLSSVAFFWFVGLNVSGAVLWIRRLMCSGCG